MKLKLNKRTYYRGTDDTKSVFLLGHAFGPSMMAVCATCEDALSEYDERFGERVDSSDSALKDYPNGVDDALDCGDIRINDGGTMVWVDHYEWVREFRSIREAKAWLNQF